MYHVLLVEPDDEFCRFLREAMSRAGCRVTMATSATEATTALSSVEPIDQVITEAWLPDSSGLLFAQDARRTGKRVFVLRKRRGRVVVFDREGAIFVGDRAGVAAFLPKILLLENNGAAPASAARRAETRQKRARR
jgi:CheY-like chemotaxis protein